MEDEQLYKAGEFFKLKVASSQNYRMAYIVSRHQPMGFVDEDGRVWVPVMEGDELVRQEVNT